MKTSIGHLPTHKQAELKAITGAIVKGFSDVEMIILYGSYARGEQVEDRYKEKGTVYEYRSDYDILVILYTNAKANDACHTVQLDRAIVSAGSETIAQAIYHGIDFVNRQLEEGGYFFTEIVEQGIELYNSGRHQLNPKRDLNFAEVKAIAQKDFDNWFSSANVFLKHFEYAFKDGNLNKAAFELHHATERYYAATQLVFTGYKPKTHDLDHLGNYVNNLDKRFVQVFPRNNKQEEDCFILLKKAYVDARYDMDYSISPEQLTYLSSRVTLLKELTEKICGQKIEGILKEA